MSALLDAATAFAEAGMCVIPASADGSKSPAVRWQPYQKRRPAPGQVATWLGGETYDGFGLVCGTVSGGLEMLEFEGRAVVDGTLKKYADSLGGHALGELWERISKGYAEVTPSGGLHLLYRVAGEARGNTKLARTTAGEVLVETRGEGGFTIVAPSGGRTHPTGGPWQLVRGGPASVAVITTAERDALYAVASLLDQSPPRPPAAPPVRFVGEPGGRPGDDYAVRVSWAQILAPHGWEHVRSFGDGADGWRRPGKDGPGISATTRESAGLYVFSTSTVFDAEVPYSKFGAFAVLNHGGDHAAAARQLRLDGYGERDDLGSILARNPHTRQVSVSGGNGEDAIGASTSPDNKPGEYGGSGEYGEAKRVLRLTCARDIRPRPVRWTWEGMIPAGQLTLVAGREGVGKSLVTVNLAARLTRGTLPGIRHGTPARVFIAASEDAWEFTVAPRLIAAGADMSLAYRVEVVEDAVVSGLILPLDTGLLAEHMKMQDVALLVIDPLTSAMDTRLDGNKDREVRAALEPLGRLAEQTMAAVVGLVHHGKRAGDDPVNLILGSRAFSAVSRQVLAAARDPDDENTCILSAEKSNLGRLNVPALTYQVHAAEIETGEGIASAGKLVWTGETTRRVRDIMAGDDGERGALADATEWLHGYMKECGGKVPAADAKTDAKAAGISDRTLDRARARLGLEPKREGFGKGSVVWWLAPEMLEPPLCTVCGLPMNSRLAAATGWTAHPDCADPQEET